MGGFLPSIDVVLFLLLIHDTVSNLEGDARGFLAEDKTAAEFATYIALIEDGVDLAKGMHSVKGGIKHRVLLTFVHVGHHHFHGCRHLDVRLDLGVDLDRLTRVIIELLLARQEHARLGTADELWIESCHRCDGKRSCQSECNCLHLCRVSRSNSNCLFNL